MNFSLKFKGGKSLPRGGKCPPRPPLNEALTSGVFIHGTDHTSPA